ncbi:MAG TPA: DUF4410 domain-containing protein [Stellaceae bacterium]|nr:DUF4410 domain-containing protein [Stellaceae bacterium]
MRSTLIAAAAAILCLLAGCVQQQAGTGGGGHPNLIIVRQFTVSPGLVTLDPSFGFSLNRGEPGVPPRQRAESVGRAAAFDVADTIGQQLSSLGYDVAQSDNGGPEPGGRALIVSGAFRHIDEGRRRRVGAENASIAADVEIDYQAAGAAPSRIMSFALDSRQVARGGIIGATAARGRDISSAATRLGAAIARAVNDVTRLNNWPAAPR